VTVRRWLIALAGATALLLPFGIPLRAATTHPVEIVDFAFNPATLTISVGDTVTWTNSDAVEHTATGSGFDSGLLDQSESYSLTFSAEGTYDYLCTPHPTMTGQIVVQPAAEATPGTVPNVAMERPPPSAAWIAALALVAIIASAIVYHSPRAVRAATGRRR
jgi:amicyanin